MNDLPDPSATVPGLITIVIPAYNAARWIERTLESICRQTYRNLDIIVVNDGSRDETARLVFLEAEQDPRIRLLTIDNGGVANARNHGISLAKGEFIAFCDADDIWHPKKIERQYEALAALDATWGAAYTLHYVIDTDDRIIRTGGRLFASGFILHRHLFYRFIGNGSTLLIRRSALLEVGQFNPDEAMKGCEDIDLEIRLAERYRIAAIPLRLVGYRMHGGNFSGNLLKMSRSLAEVYRLALMRNPQIHRSARRKIAASRYRYTFEGFIGTRDFRQALLFGFRFFRNDPYSFLEFAGRKFVTLLYKASGKRSPYSRSIEGNPPFANAPPDYDIRGSENSRTWKMLGKLDKTQEDAISGGR